MEKEEDTTRELLLPNWQGSGSHGLTIAQRDDGVFVQEVMQNSPAARTGVVKEGESPQGVAWVPGRAGRGWGREGHRGRERPVPVASEQSAPKAPHSPAPSVSLDPSSPRGKRLWRMVATSPLVSPLHYS